MKNYLIEKNIGFSLIRIINIFSPELLSILGGGNNIVNLQLNFAIFFISSLVKRNIALNEVFQNYSTCISYKYKTKLKKWNMIF